MNSMTTVNEYSAPPQPATGLLDGVETLATPMSEWSDQQLVQACLGGDEAAWAVLIRRYQNVMYFFARRYGASSADAADVFQLVCAELFVSLPRLRNQHSLRSWIMTVSAHQAYHWKRGFLKRARREAGDNEAAFDALSTPPSSEFELRQREEAMRLAIDQLPPRCQVLVRLLFYEDPPLPYEAVAQRLGLATGSIGLTRSRCLKKLQRILEGRGAGAGCGHRNPSTATRKGTTTLGAGQCCAAPVHERSCETP
jgi:RNA polymerase sigma factor (sigma-70 family)